MTVKTQRKKAAFRIPVFYICLLVGVALALIAMTVGLARLRAVLADYEAAQPKYAAKEVFNTHFNPPDFAALAAQSGMPENLSPLETEEGLVAELTERYAGQETSNAATTAGSDGSLRYLVKAASRKLPSFPSKHWIRPVNTVLISMPWAASSSISVPKRVCRSACQPAMLSMLMEICWMSVTSPKPASRPTPVAICPRG